MSALGTFDMQPSPETLLALADHAAAMREHAAALNRFAAALEAQAPSAPAVRAPTRPAQSAGPAWATPDRVALLREIVPSRRTWEEIVGALAALPGPTIPAPVTVQSFTKKALKLHRRMTPDGEKIKVPHALTPERIRTPARDALLRREWPAGTDGAVILEQFNALPGRQVARGRLAILAAEIGVRRPDREIPRSPLPALEPAPAPIPVPLPDAPSALGSALVAAAVPRPQPVAKPAPAPPKPAPQPISRAEALARVGQIKAPAQQRPVVAWDPIEADLDQVRTWAAQRGLQVRDWEELPAVNRKCEQLGLPTFKRRLLGRSVHQTGVGS